MNRIGCILMTGTAVVLAGRYAGSAQPPSATSQPASAPAGAASAQPIQSWITDLSSSRWEVRHRATNELMAAGPAAYPALKELFARTGSYDVRRRIRTIVEQNELYRGAEDRGGFLGIQPLPVDDKVDPNVAHDQVWIKITRVVEATGAQRAGLREGDYIATVDGRLVKDVAKTGLGITPWIKSHQPGTKVRLGVVRDGQMIEVVATLGRRAPSQMDAPSIMASNKRQDAATRFSVWWRKEFDPDGNVDETTSAASDPQWTLESAHAGP